MCTVALRIQDPLVFSKREALQLIPGIISIDPGIDISIDRSTTNLDLIFYFSARASFIVDCGLSFGVCSGVL